MKTLLVIKCATEADYSIEITHDCNEEMELKVDKIMRKLRKANKEEQLPWFTNENGFMLEGPMQSMYPKVKMKHLLYLDGLLPLPLSPKSPIVSIESVGLFLYEEEFWL